MTALKQLRRCRLAFSNWLSVVLLSRLDSAARWRLLRRAGAPVLRRTVVIRPRAAAPLRARITDIYAVYQCYAGGEYEFDVVDWKEMRTVIDCGANIGSFTRWVTDRSACQVLAVEPGRANLRLLHENVRALGDRVRIKESAAAARSGPVVFHERLRGATSSTTHQPSDAHDAASSYEVSGVSLPELLRYSGFDTVDVLKLDVEGAEREIFATLHPDRLANVSRLIVECHPDVGADPGPVIDVLRRAGMQVAVQARTAPLVVAWR